MSKVTRLVHCGADLSDCETYRYSLVRSWDDADRAITFIGMNPSTADASTDDATIRKCMNYVSRWGGNKLIMVNLFAFRSTDPEVLTRYLRNGGDYDGLIGGPENKEALDDAYIEAGVTVAAWGSRFHSTAPAIKIREDYKEKLFALKLNKNGAPAHPLYLKKDIEPGFWGDKDYLKYYRQS